MKIKRFVAPDMRTAIRLVREEQGDHAVILSNRRVAEGIEVVSATDYDAALVQQAVASAPKSPPRQLPSDAARATARAETTARANAKTRTPVSRPVRTPATVPVRESQPAAGKPVTTAGRWALLDEVRGRQNPVAPAPPASKTGRQQAAPANDEIRALKKELLGVRTLLKMQLQREPGVDEVRRELSAMQEQLRQQAAGGPGLGRLQKELSEIRGLVSDQLARLSVKELGHIAPKLGQTYLDLLDFGLPEPMARRLVDRAADGKGRDDHKRPWQVLERALPVADLDPLGDGGIVALVGPAGVGKTTTIAKLAARYAEHFGPREVALVTTDGHRVGAQEQLYSYGRLAGVPVHAAGNAAELRALLQRLSVYKLVLIDTAGLGLRDPRLTEELRTLSDAAPGLRTMLVLNAMAGERDMADTVRRFRVARPDTCIITHLDECSQAGPALGAAIAGRLQIGWIADGQTVPQDLHRASARDLMLRGMQRLHESRRRQRSAPMPVEAAAPTAQAVGA